jgi:pectate lyase/pectin methylesterase-like acyl-CoA thioesterase
MKTRHASPCRPLRLTLAWASAVIAVLSSAFAQNPAVFVNLSTTQASTAGVTPTSAATITIAAPGSGWTYGASAPYAGETWNNILSPHANDQIKPQPLGLTQGAVVPLITANNIALTQPDGSATVVTLTASAILDDAGTATNTREVPRLVNVSSSTPSGLMGTAWRIFEGGNRIGFTFSGLPANAHYVVYGYASTNAANQGARFTLVDANAVGPKWFDTNPVANTAPSIFVSNAGVLSPSAPAPLEVASNAAGGANSNTTWGVLHAKVDSNGKIEIRASRNANNNGFPNGLQLIPYPKATITTQPSANASGTVGDGVTLTVAASGFNASDVLTYQWRKAGAAIDPAANPSAATASLALSNLQSSDAGSYDVVVTNYGGDAISSATALTVTSGAVAPTITTQPAAQTAVAGGNVSFSVSANGTSPLTYTWEKSITSATTGFTDIPGSNSATLSLTNVTGAEAGYYRVRVQNSVNTAVSDAVALIVAPVITTQPTAATVTAGSTTTLTVGVDAGAGAPEATTYVWKRNGVALADGSGISGAATATLQIASFAAANSGTYSVTASNSAGSVTSNSVYRGTVTSLTSEAWPANNATGVNPDTPPTLRFSAAPVVGTAGQIRVYDASNDALVETIDLATLSVKTGGGGTYRYSTKTIGDRTYHYFPVVVVGNEARITLKASTTLAYNKTYYVQVDPGALLDSTGATFAGISDTTSWRFTTKASGPADTATAIVVAADGTGDFTTLQGAIDLIPHSPANTTTRTITLKAGIYNELVNLRTGKNRIIIQGEGRANTTIQYLINNDLLTGGAHFSSRAVLRAETTNLELYDLTVRNLTPKGGGQAEAIAITGSLATIARCNFYSFQDTLFLGKNIFLTDCYVEGDTDFIWGGTAFFQRCELKMMFPAYNSNPRNAANEPGHIFVDCTFSRSSAANVPDDSAYFSRDFGSAASMFFLINCKVDKHIKGIGWLVDATDKTAVRYWEYASKNMDGTPYVFTGRATWNHMSTGVPGAAAVLDHQQVDAITAAWYSDPLNVIGFAPAVAPTIDTQPVSASVDAGATVSFTAGGLPGYPAATYQWKKGGVDIPGATAATLTLTNVQGADAGDYTLTLTNSAGSATSQAATLTVNTTVIPTAIITQPVSQSVTEGQAVTLAVAAEGSALSYQWKKDGTDIPGATSASLSLSGLSAADSGAYTVVVTGTGGVVTSNVATLTVGVRTVKTVFSDAFSTGSTVNSATPADPTDTSTAYQILSDKGYNPTPAVGATGLRFGIGNTSSGNVEAQALFSPAPVILSGVGDYLELTATLTNVRGMFSAGNNTFYVGLYDSNQVAPVARGLNGTMTGGAFTHALGYVQNWTGYVSRTVYNGGSHQIATRVPQTGNNNQNQSLASVAYRNPTGAGVGTAQPSTLASFPEGAQYTTVLRITRSGSGEYTIESRLHEGTGTAGTVLVTYSGVATGATFLTDNSDHLGFDGLAFGARVSGTGQTIEINSVNITTNASLIPVPRITAQPQGQTVGVGQTATFSVTAEGTGLTYQWFKNDVAINGATDASYTLASAAGNDQGQYKVVVTNDLGGRSTSARAELIVDIAAGTKTPDGFARAVTGGGNRAAVTVTTAADFKTYAEQVDPAVITISGTLNVAATGNSIRVKSNKTIQGIDANATIIGSIFIGEGVENVLIRGLNITNPGTTLGSDGRYTDGGDGIGIDGAKHVFITHCTIFDCADGLIDTRLGADFVTISWCEFYYTAAQLDHRFSNIADGFLVRNSADEVIETGAPLRLTLHHNWWSDRCDQRLPSSTNGHVHLYNNYWNTPNNSYASLARDAAQFLSEHNAYVDVKSPLSKSDNNALIADGLIRAIGNLYTNITGTAPDAGTDTVFTPTYSYQMLTASDVAGVVTQGAGNTAGAASASLSEGAATLNGPSGVVPVNTSFTLTASVTGFTPVSYQWRKNNFAINGATSAAFTVAAMKSTDEGAYTLAMTNAAGDTLVSESHAIVYSSALVPTIVTQPVNQSVPAGSAASFAVVAEGDAPLTYQWQKSLNGVFTNVTGATSSSFGFTNAQSVHAGQYRVVISNAVGTATSVAVTLTVNAASTGGSSGVVENGSGGGGGSPSLWFLGALALLVALRRRFQRG